ncbi:hypothetical protein OG518_01645 [Streptomyces sp. NBC_01397]|nr:hypothetical protein OG518_01645 [Streptomyces sp. NBC_01397]
MALPQALVGEPERLGLEDFRRIPHLGEPSLTVAPASSSRLDAGRDEEAGATAQIPEGPQALQVDGFVYCDWSTGTSVTVGLIEDTTR